MFITIADHTLPIDIDFGALISLLNWKAFQTVNPKSNISLLSTKSKFKMYSRKTGSTKDQSEIKLSYEFSKIRTTFLIAGEQSPNILGRNIFGKLQLNWKNILHLFAFSEVTSNSDNVTSTKSFLIKKLFF